MDPLGAIMGFLLGVLAGIILWIPFVFAPVAAFGNIHADMPGWAIAASIWWYFLCGIAGAVVGGREF